MRTQKKCWLKHEPQPSDSPYFLGISHHFLECFITGQSTVKAFLFVYDKVELVFEEKFYS